MKEIWKSIPNYEGLYEASNLGKIRSLDRRGADGRKLRGKVLSPCLCGPDRCNYYFVNLSNYKADVKSHKVHRLVYSSFHGEIPINRVVDHIDGDRYNNRSDNLQCITQRKNIEKSVTSKAKQSNGLPCGVYFKGSSYFSVKYIDGIQYNLGSHKIMEVVECYYNLATKTLLHDEDRWKDVRYEIACIYEDFHK